MCAHRSVNPIKGGSCRRRENREGVGLLDGEPVKRTPRRLLVQVPSVIADGCTPWKRVSVFKACEGAALASIQVQIAS